MSDLASIGVIGLGIMGLPMAINLKKAGYDVWGYNRSERGRDAGKQAGIAMVGSPCELADKVNIVITMVTNPQAIKDVIEGENGLWQSQVAHKIWVQMSTLDVPSTELFAQEASQRSMIFIDCPVTGSKKQVEEAQLILLAGGSAEIINNLEPMLLALGRTIVRAGDVGKGTALKLCMNLIVAQMTTALCESVVLADAQQLNPQTIFEVLSNSPALNCGYFKIKENNLLTHQFAPAFSLENMLKDVRFITKTAQRHKQPLPVTEAVQSVMEMALAQGLGAEDLTTLIKTY